MLRLLGQFDYAEEVQPFCRTINFLIALSIAIVYTKVKGSINQLILTRRIGAYGKKEITYSNRSRAAADGNPVGKGGGHGR
jgi:hypothetical protein